MKVQSAESGTRERRGEAGQVLVIVAAAMAGILGFLALVVDVGLLYAERARAMNAAEAAATAGVQWLPGDVAAATATAVDYAQRNGIAAGQTTVTITQSNTQLRVSVRKDVQLFFARVLGINTAPVSGKAAVRLLAVQRVTGAAPLGVEKQSFVYGGTYYLKNSPGYGGSYKGNFGCLALGGRGGANYANNLANGYQGELQLGDIVETEPGNKSGPTNDGISARMNADPTGTYENHRPDSPRILKVPVVEWSAGGGRSTAKVVGFAAFWLEGSGGSGDQNYVTGRFMQLLASPGEGQWDLNANHQFSGQESHDDSMYNYGLYSYRIIE
jgi:Flp pilus assembly protein TadG